MTFFLVKLNVFPVKACFCFEKLLVTNICENTLISDTQLVFSCSKLTMETPEQCKKCVRHQNNVIDVILVSLFLALSRFQTCSGVSIVEQANAI